MDIRAFIAARLDEAQVDAEAAQAADPGPWTANTSDDTATNERSGHGAGLVTAADDVALWDCEGSNTLCMTAPTARHVAHWDPSHVLIEIAAKRRILERHAPGGQIDPYHGAPRDGCGREGDLEQPRCYINECPELQDLAATDAGHEDYDPAWTPS